MIFVTHAVFLTNYVGKNKYLNKDQSNLAKGGMAVASPLNSLLVFAR